MGLAFQEFFHLGHIDLEAGAHGGGHSHGWSEVKDYVAFFYEELFTPATEYPQNISKEDTLAILNQYKGIYNPADDGETWFNKVREMGEALGFAGKPKDYKKNPDQYKGHVGDVSQVIRLAITGRTNSPDLCSVMQILGPVGTSHGNPF